MTTKQIPRPANPQASPTARSLGGHQLPHPNIPGTTSTISPSGGVQTSRSANLDAAPIPDPLGADRTPQSAIDVATPMGVPSVRDQATRSHMTIGTYCEDAAGAGPEQPTIMPPTPTERAPAAPVPFSAGRQLAFAATTLDDIEAMRTANANRLRTLTRGGPADERIVSGECATIADLPPDKDGEDRGFGLSADDPAVEFLARTVAEFENIEAQAIRLLEKQLRAHPLGPWIARQKGIGDKQGARLLAALGDPYIRPEIVAEDGTTEPPRPRMVSELISYSGWLPGINGGEAPRRRRGEMTRWNPDARKRTWLVIESCLKQTGGKSAGVCPADNNGWLTHAIDCPCSPYRVVYDDARRQYADAVHAVDCAQCKAKVGEPLRLGHQKARAMRLAARQLIKDLWAEARRLHVEGVPA